VERKVSRGAGAISRPDRIAHRLALFALILALAAAHVAGAGPATSRAAELPGRVLAHLPLAAPAGSQMVLERRGDKRYLYIQQAEKLSYIVVEVTQPEFPSFVNRQAPSNANDSAAGERHTVGQGADVPEAPDSASKTSIRSSQSLPDTLKLLDVSDPEHPTTLQTFKNVIGMLADGGRGIIYLTNDEGLWVLKHNREQIQQEKKKPPCDLKPGRPVIQDCQ